MDSALRWPSILGTQISNRYYSPAAARLTQKAYTADHICRYTRAVSSRSRHSFNPFVLPSICVCRSTCRAVAFTRLVTKTGSRTADARAICRRTAKLDECRLAAAIPPRRSLRCATLYWYPTSADQWTNSWTFRLSTTELPHAADIILNTQYETMRLHWQRYRRPHSCSDSRFCGDYFVPLPPNGDALERSDGRSSVKSRVAEALDQRKSTVDFIAIINSNRLTKYVVWRCCGWCCSAAALEWSATVNVWWIDV